MDVMGAASPSAGLIARLEAGYKPLAPLALFAAAQWSSLSGADAEVGVRWQF